METKHSGVNNAKTSRADGKMKRKLHRESRISSIVIYVQSSKTSSYVYQETQFIYFYIIKGVPICTSRFVFSNKVPKI